MKMEQGSKMASHHHLRGGSSNRGGGGNPPGSNNPSDKENVFTGIYESAHFANLFVEFENDTREMAIDVPGRLYFWTLFFGWLQSILRDPDHHTRS